MNSPKDDAIVRLLPGTLKGSAEAPAGMACLDADMLAAWDDQALDAGERHAVETHAAGCARCQAMLAAMVTTMPAAAVTPPSRARAFWWFAAAVAPVAAALVIWFAVPPRELIQTSQSAETAAARSRAVPGQRAAERRALGLR